MYEMCHVRKKDSHVLGALGDLTYHLLGEGEDWGRSYLVGDGTQKLSFELAKHEVPI